MVFAARFLIRLASLLPDEVDLRQTGRDVEALASRLDEGTFKPTKRISLTPSSWLLSRSYFAAGLAESAQGTGDSTENTTSLARPNDSLRYVPDSKSSLTLEFGLDLFLADDLLGGAGIGGDWGAVRLQCVLSLMDRILPHLTTPRTWGSPCPMTVRRCRKCYYSALIDQGVANIPQPFAVDGVHDTANWSESFAAFWLPNNADAMGSGP
jgi:hypothetical protein